MYYLLNIIALFISFLGLFYLFLTGEIRKSNKRFILVALLTIVVNESISFIYLFSKTDYPRLVAVNTPPLMIIMVVALFLYMYQELKQVKLASKFIILNFFPVSILIVFGLLIFLYQPFSSEAIFNILIVRYILAVLLLVTYHGVINKLRLKRKATNALDQQLIGNLLIFMQITWVSLLVWLVQFSISNKLFTGALFVFLKLLIIILTVAIYFYLFESYKQKLKRDQKSRQDGFELLSVKNLLALYGTATNSLKTDKEGEIDKRYEKSLIDSNLLEKQKEIVLEYLDKNPKVILHSNFNLNFLSKETGISKHHLSQVFNISLSITFSKYLKNKRIDYACEQLKKMEEKDINFTRLAETIGYKSRSSFYQNFKEVTGLTPSEYIKMNPD